MGPRAGAAARGFREAPNIIFAALDAARAAPALRLSHGDGGAARGRNNAAPRWIQAQALAFTSLLVRTHKRRNRGVFRGSPRGTRLYLLDVREPVTELLRGLREALAPEMVPSNPAISIHLNSIHLNGGTDLRPGHIDGAVRTVGRTALHI